MSPNNNWPRKNGTKNRLIRSDRDWPRNDNIHIRLPNDERVVLSANFVLSEWNDGGVFRRSTAYVRQTDERRLCPRNSTR